METKNIYIFRHGETDWNLQKKFQGSTPNVPLNTTGVSQAEKIAQQLKEIDFQIIYTSPLARALETTTIVCVQYSIMRQVVRPAWFVKHVLSPDLGALNRCCFEPQRSGVAPGLVGSASSTCPAFGQVVPHMSSARVELVHALSGGHLKHGLVPRHTASVDGITYIRLGKQDADITSFLTGVHWAQHPLKATTTVETLQTLRNSQFLEMQCEPDCYSTVQYRNVGGRG